MNTLLALLVSLALPLCLACCHSTTSNPVPTVPAPGSLLGEWSVTRLNGKDVAAEAARLPWMRIDNGGEVNGWGGVNRFTTQLDPPALARGEFQLSSFTSTEMAGSPEARKLEQEFFTALHVAARFAAERDRAELTDASGKQLISLARKRTP